MAKISDLKATPRLALLVFRLEQSMGARESPPSSSHTPGIKLRVRALGRRGGQYHFFYCVEVQQGPQLPRASHHTGVDHGNMGTIMPNNLDSISPVMNKEVHQTSPAVVDGDDEHGFRVSERTSIMMNWANQAGRVLLALAMLQFRILRSA